MCVRQKTTVIVLLHLLCLVGASINPSTTYSQIDDDRYPLVDHTQVQVKQQPAPIEFIPLPPFETPSVTDSVAQEPTNTSTDRPISTEEVENDNFDNACSDAEPTSAFPSNSQTSLALPTVPKIFTQPANQLPNHSSLTAAYANRALIASGAL